MLARRRLGRSRGLAMGFLFMATGFAVVALAVRAQDRLIILVSCAIMVTLMTLGQILAVPLAQDLVALLAGERRLGMYFGFLGSVGGFVVLAGNAIVGALFDHAEQGGSTDAVPWWFLACVPLVSAVILSRTARRVAPHEQPLSRVT
jgi:MFS family permease